MILGALVDLGLPVETLAAELQKLPLRGYRLEGKKVQRSSLAATKVDVVIEDAHAEGHDAHHPHPHHHQTDHAPGHAHHRRLADILGLLEASTLTDDVKTRSAQLFSRLAEAEASVHGTTLEAVHFHEVGAVDSIVDIVGGVIGFSWLRADRVVASPLNVGTGTVSMSHGTFPVPPPATARLIQGAPVYGAGEGELLTPTGALLVTAFATEYGALPMMRPEAVGYGAGTREVPGRPNVFRMVVGEDAASAVAGERVLVMETEIDDMSPQLFGPLLDRVLAAGALDVYYTAIQMKKGRPGVLLTAVVPTGGRAAVEDVLFTETTTLGVRFQEWERTALPRERIEVETVYGRVGVKVARRHGAVVNAQPEFDDCQRLATLRGIPVKEVWAAALTAYRQAGLQTP